MPLPVAPTKSTCSSCGWSTVTKHKSDVIFLPRKCERCGSEKLNHTPAGLVDRLLHSIL
jgi:ribosomal protein L37E